MNALNFETILSNYKIEILLWLVFLIVLTLLNIFLVLIAVDVFL